MIPHLLQNSITWRSMTALHFVSYSFDARSNLAHTYKSEFFIWLRGYLKYCKLSHFGVF